MESCGWGGAVPDSNLGITALDRNSKDTIGPFRLWPCPEQWMTVMRARTGYLRILAVVTPKQEIVFRWWWWWGHYFNLTERVSEAV